MDPNDRENNRPLSAIAESNTQEDRLQTTGIVTSTDQEKIAQDIDAELALQGGTVGTAVGEQIPLSMLAAAGNGFANGNGNGEAYDGRQTTGVYSTRATAEGTAPPPPGSYATTKVGSRMFLSITGLLSVIAWFVSFIAQIIVSVDVNPEPVRILWFPLILQIILIALIVEVIIGSASYNAAYAYGTQISILASLVTVFGVIGVDRNLHASPTSSQKATAAGWLINTLINLFWIAYFTSPPDSPLVILGNKLKQGRLETKTREMISRGEVVRPPPTVERIEKSTDAFPTSAHNLLKKTNRTSQRYSTATSNGGGRQYYGQEQAQGHGRRGTAGAHGVMPSEDHTLAEGRPGNNRYTMASATNTAASERNTFGQENRQSSAGVAGLGSGGGSGRGSAPSAGVPTGTGVGERRGGDDEGSIRPSSGNSGPSLVALNTVRTGTGRVSMAPQTMAEMTPVASSTPLMRMGADEEFGTKWKAEALFEYNANASDLNEISFKKGEILSIIDKSGKWWEARGADGRVGIAPSNYLRLLK